MNKSHTRWFVILVLPLLLSACFGPKTPQEVTQAFWKAVLNNDAKDVVQFSTLANTKNYDAFSKKWTDFHAEWGRVVIEQKQASVVSNLIAPANSDQEDRKFITYLVKQNGKWMVDYNRTKLSVNGGVLGDLFGQLNQLGNQLGKQLDSSADKFRQEMDRMSKELEQMAKSFNDQASKSLNDYAEQLQNKLKQLEDSINRALNENKKLPEHDRQTLEVAEKNLQQDRQRLQKPDVNTILESNRNIGVTQQSLNSLEDSSLDQYKREWQDLTREIQDAMKTMLDQLSNRQHHQNV